MQIVSDTVWTKVSKKLIRRWILAKLSKPIEIPNKTIQNDQDLSALSRVFNFESCSKWFEFFGTYTHRSVAIRSVSDPIAICHRFDDRPSIEESICCKLQHVWMACFFGTNRVIRCTLASYFVNVAVHFFRNDLKLKASSRVVAIFTLRVLCVLCVLCEQLLIGCSRLSHQIESCSLISNVISGWSHDLWRKMENTTSTGHRET